MILYAGHTILVGTLPNFTIELTKNKSDLILHMYCSLFRDNVRIQRRGIFTPLIARYMQMSTITQLGTSTVT